MDNERRKDTKLRYSEYYGMQEIYDNLHQKSVENQNFNSLMKVVTSDDNILLAYRSIKRNGGSLTAGVDGKTIKDIEKLNTDYGQTNVPPLPSFLPLNDKECTNPCQYVYQYLRYN